MVKHPLCHFAKSILQQLIIFLFCFVFFKLWSSLIPPLLSKVHGCQCCFSLATQGGAVPLCRWLTGGGCGCVYCYNVVLPMLLQENKRGPSCPRGTDLTSLILSADFSLCFVEGSIRPDQCRRETPLPCRAGLRWRHSWWGAERGAERRGWDSGGPLTTRRLLSPSDGSADDSGPPGSCREKKRSGVKRWTEVLFCWIKTLSPKTANLLKNDGWDLITAAIFATSLVQFSLYQTEDISVLSITAQFT